MKRLLYGRDRDLPKILIFASGDATGGGSGFLRLVLAMLTGLLRAEIVGVVSNHEFGGVRKIADEYGIPFHHVAKQPSAQEYRDIVGKFGAQFCFLSGWMLFVVGIDAINIHPGILPETARLHGDAVHIKAMTLYLGGKIPYSAVTMHLVLESGNTVIDKDRYDIGPILFQVAVPFYQGDDWKRLKSRVNATEHLWQAHVTNAIANGAIRWNSQGSVIVPDGYEYLTLPGAA